jgi:hypothetical protein
MAAIHDKCLLHTAKMGRIPSQYGGLYQGLTEARKVKNW